MRALTVAYTLAAVLGAGYFILDGAVPNVIGPFNQTSGDCDVDLTGAHIWLEGRDPYSDKWLKEVGISQFGHPPTTPFWFLFFRSYNYTQTHGISGVMVLLMLITLLYLLATELQAPVVPATVALAFGFVIHQGWMGYHLSMMQLGVPIAFLYVLSWWFLRRGRAIEGGAMLGLACTFKLFPGVMMLFLLLTRRWKAFLSGAAAWLAIALFMTSRYGIRCWPEYFSKQGGTADFWMGNIKNGSVQGIVLRLFHPSCERHFGTVRAATLLAFAISALLLGVSWWLSRRLARDDKTLDGPFALFSLLSVFLNPWIWEHYYVLLIFPWAVALSLLVQAARATGAKRAARWKIAAGAAALGAVVWLLTLDMYAKSPASGHLRMHLYEVANWLVWPILIALLCLLVFRQDRGRFSSRMDVS